VLGPLLYVLYTAELELIVARHGLRLHMYADNCQMYLNTSVEDVPLAVNKFAACVADINAWLSACRLWLNAAKTQLLWLGSSQLVDRVDCHDVLVLGTRVAISDTARDLGVVIDRELSLAALVTAVCRSGYNQLRQLRPVVSVTVSECHQDARPLVSLGLLQLTAVRHQRLTTSTPAVGAERCRPPVHRRPSV